MVPGHLGGRQGKSLQSGVQGAGLPPMLKKVAEQDLERVAPGDERESLRGSDCIYFETQPAWSCSQRCVRPGKSRNLIRNIQRWEKGDSAIDLCGRSCTGAIHAFVSPPSSLKAGY